MIDFFDRLYTSLDNSNRIFVRLRLYKVGRVFVRLAANIIMPLYFRLTRNNATHRLPPITKTEGRFIVTLTSFPARTPRIWLVIETMLRQTVKPDMIVLWLSAKQFPDTDDIPESLRQLTVRGLTIELVPDDYRSHKKYHYCLKRYPNDHIITIDDDVFYDTHLVERMIEEHRKFPTAVITNKAHQMTFDTNGHLRPYSQWNFDTKEDSDLFVIGAGANLYPAHCLHQMAADIDLAMRLTPTGDDIWLNAMARLINTPIVHTPYYALEQLPVINRHNVTLNATNVTHSNDIQIHALLTYLDENKLKNPFIKE